MPPQQSIDAAPVCWNLGCVAESAAAEGETLRSALREIAYGGNGCGLTVSAPQYARDALARAIAKTGTQEPPR